MTPEEEHELNYYAECEAEQQRAAIVGEILYDTWLGIITEEQALGHLAWNGVHIDTIEQLHEMVEDFIQSQQTQG